MSTTPTPDADTVPVRFEVKAVERVLDRGALVGLAIVDIDIAGVELTLQGVQIVREAGGLSIRSPVFRHPRSGRWLPGVLLPPELAEAIRAEVGPRFVETL